MKGLKRIRRLSKIAWRAFGVIVLSAGLGLAAYAGVEWLQTARWQPLTINGALAASPTTRNWVDHPRSWVGLHRVVVPTLRVPVYLIVTLVGVALLIFSDPLTRDP
jgi:hypothetical protein